MTAEEVAEVRNRVRAGGCQIAGALPIRARRPGAEAIQRPVRVPAAVLDDLLDSRLIAPPQVIKLDVEGAELMCCSTGLTYSPPPAVFVELHQFGLQSRGVCDPWASIESFLSGASFTRFRYVDSAHLVALRSVP
jgi:hypothetical protein